MSCGCGQVAAMEDAYGRAQQLLLPALLGPLEPSSTVGLCKCPGKSEIWHGERLGADLPILVISFRVLGQKCKAPSSSLGDLPPSLPALV